MESKPVELLTLFNKESEIPLRKLAAIALISGFSNTLLLAIINTAAEHVANQSLELHLFFLYFLVFILYAYTQRYIMLQVTIALETMVNTLRLRLANKIRLSHLRFVEAAGEAKFYTQLTQQSNVISQIAFQLSVAVQSVFLVFSSVIYLIWVSPMSALIALGMMIAVVPLQVTNNKSATAKLQTASHQQSQLFAVFGHLLHGFKELKFSARKSQDLATHMEDVANQAQVLKVEASHLEVTAITLIRLSFYIVVAALAFVIPVFSDAYTDQIFKLVATMLFILGPLNISVASIPTLNRANVAIRGLYQLEEELDAASRQHYYASSTTPPETFTEIHLDNASFQYRNAQEEVLFAVENINLQLRAGEILFIVGGNGSGKSTLLKVLTGLYFPTAGSIHLNGTPVKEEDVHNYREIFATIFTDFHLFDRLYGVPDVDENTVNDLLKEMELDKKTRYAEGKFTNIDLSTGQKKRLAFIAAMLEDKSVYVFDEFAADQDPQFRKRFYEVMLQELKAKGKTVIAVSHDDKYFHTADRVIKMDYGKLVDYDEEKHKL